MFKLVFNMFTLCCALLLVYVCVVRWPLQGAMMGELELVAQWIPLDQLGR
jgi:hypothetical protein